MHVMYKVCFFISYYLLKSRVVDVRMNRLFVGLSKAILKLEAFWKADNCS